MSLKRIYQEYRLYFLNMLCGSSFLEETPKSSFRIIQKSNTSKKEFLAKKFRKHELDLKYLVPCPDSGAPPKFTWGKNVNKNNQKQVLSDKLRQDKTFYSTRSVRNKHLLRKILEHQWKTCQHQKPSFKELYWRYQYIKD